MVPEPHPHCNPIDRPIPFRCR